MMKCVKPRLITFDVTGTLLMTKLEEHYIEVGHKYGLSIEPRQLAQSFKNNFRRLAIEHPIYGKYTGLGWENWWRTIVYNVFKDQNKNVSTETLDKVANTLIECYSTSKCWHMYPGAIELLECLRKYRIVLGVISNFDERLEPILIDLKIRPFFSFVLTSYDFGKEKPDVSIFVEALRLANKDQKVDIVPQQAIHIGDTIDNDYFGAKNAQWNSLLISHEQKRIDERKVCKEDIFINLQDLQRHFEMFLNKIKNRRNV
ncbi:rhythmically expressed protein 2 protein-like [Vespula maculifrons]|uniref:Rhythmically expressed gene 2 protein n=3 Tax=Vespula TaxID=7451 RepID=A0A834NTZ4_VESGE|nr:rhythmically expressed gene 2 protein-like [Vespula vulgaris]XP_050858325.1 rhythmically expressed gene 2 protein-like [Vespula vulgaris]KAF7411597.1 hypothetical protein HZH66_000493 [Vespula vulgaris]KAF7417883.1 hypothetical protein HZH68_000536 [Vespula germanica]